MAVATPCWPAPVSAITRGLPIRWARSAWPSALLILWAPVWSRSSRFRYTGPAGTLGEALRVVERRRPAHVARQQPVEPLAEGRVGARLRPTPARAARAPASASRARSGRRSGRSAARRRWPSGPGCGGRALHGLEEGLQPVGVLDVPARPPRRSRRRPRTAARPRVASPTFSAVSPPERTSGASPGCAAASSQSNRSPVPPYVPGHVGVEHVEVGPERRQRAHGVHVLGAHRLDHLQASCGARPRRSTKGPRRRGAGAS